MPETERFKVQLKCGPSKTKQSFKDECDINIVMAKWTKTGQITHTNKSQPQYGDFSNVDDYNTALNKIRQAEAQFAELPALIRDRFKNDPAELINFIEDGDNYDEAVELGIINPPPLEVENPPHAEANTPPDSGGETTPDQ